MNRSKTTTLPAKPPVQPGEFPNFRRVALVARDWRRETRKGAGRFLDENMGFSPHFAEISKMADRERADLLVFSLWTHDERKLGPLDRDKIFSAYTKHVNVILETTDAHGNEIVRVYRRSERLPLAVDQKLSKSSDSKGKKEALVSALPFRKLGSVLLLLCGETNIVRTKRGSGKIVDDFGVLN